MPRLVKDPEVRRAELLDCARALFFRRGYEDTTVNDIIREAGVSKGAFYHYFPSKEAVLEGVARRLAADSIAELRQAVDDPSLDGVGRLNAMLAGSRRMKVEMAAEIRAVFDVIFRPENVVLFHRIEQAVTEEALPLIADILRRGMEEGAFAITDPDATAEVLLQLRSSIHTAMGRILSRLEEGDLDAAVAMLDSRLELYGIAFDRILGLPDRTVRIVEPGFSRAFLEARTAG